MRWGLLESASYAGHRRVISLHSHPPKCGSRYSRYSRWERYSLLPWARLINLSLALVTSFAGCHHRVCFIAHRPTAEQIHITVQMASLRTPVDMPKGVLQQLRLLLLLPARLFGAVLPRLMPDANASPFSFARLPAEIKVRVMRELLLLQYEPIHHHESPLRDCAPSWMREASRPARAWPLDEPRTHPPTTHSEASQEAPADEAAGRWYSRVSAPHIYQAPGLFRMNECFTRSRAQALHPKAVVMAFQHRHRFQTLHHLWTQELWPLLNGCQHQDPTHFPHSETSSGRLGVSHRTT